MQISKISTPEVLQQAFHIREEVFMKEQRIDREDEFDEFDDESNHYLATSWTGEPVGTARWRVTEKGVKLERFAVVATARNEGVASRLLEFMLTDIYASSSERRRIFLFSQKEAMPLYAKFNFQPVGKPFLECDIWHQEMELVPGAEG